MLVDWEGGYVILHHTPPYLPYAYSTILCHTLPHSTVLYHTLPYSTILCHTLPHSTTLYHTLPYSTILYHTLPHSTILYHTLPYSAWREVRSDYSTNQIAGLYISGIPVTCCSTYSSLMPRPPSGYGTKPILLAEGVLLLSCPDHSLSQGKTVW